MVRNRYRKPGGKVPSKFKGFSMLPEDVQREMNTELAEMYLKGGKYRKRKKKFKEEGGVSKFEELTTPSKELTQGAGLAGMAGATIGQLADDNDATTYRGGEVFGDVAKGAAAGAAFGPLGAAIGGGAALVSGIVNRNKARKEEKRLKEEQLSKQREETRNNIKKSIQDAEELEEKERLERSNLALQDMNPMGSEGLSNIPMAKKYGGRFNMGGKKTNMPPPPPGFMYDKNGNLIKTNRALDIREHGGTLAGKYSIGQMR